MGAHYLSFIPLEDFSQNSDINWAADIGDIDKQLYLKYGFSDEEINYIESNIDAIE